MTEERLRYIRNLESLSPLSEHTKLLTVNELDRVEIVDRLPPPVDEYGIPRPEIMIEQLLGQMATENYIWVGRFDEHHLATPKADFTVVRTSNEGDIGSAFRGLSCLKIELPRQMHNFSHAIFELPGRPPLDIMRQAVLEVGQAKQLQMILNEFTPQYPHPQTEQMKRLCISALHRAIDGMEEPQIHPYPSLEMLSTMELSDIETSINSLLRVRQFSDKKLIHPAVRRTREYRYDISRNAKKVA